jgi:integrase/recombinase XerC
MSSQYDLKPFLRWLINEKGCLEDTAKGYFSSVSDFISWFEKANGEEFSAEIVTPTDLREYQQYLLTLKRLKPGTINRRGSALRNFFSWAKETSSIEELPRFPHPVREQNRAPQSLSRREQNRLLRAIERAGNTRDIAIVKLMIGTGLRLGETTSLELDDIDLGERHGMVTARGKGMKVREVPIPVEARHALTAWLKKHPGGKYLFVSLRGRGTRISERGVQKMIKKYAYQAGLPLQSVHPHVLRHTCAKNMLDSGADLVTVATILGHESLDTTAIYTKPRFQDLVEAVDKGETL